MSFLKCMLEILLISFSFEQCYPNCEDCIDFSYESKDMKCTLCIEGFFLYLILQIVRRNQNFQIII